MKSPSRSQNFDRYGGNFKYSGTSGIVGKVHAEGGKFRLPYRNYIVPEDDRNVQDALKRLAQNETHSMENADRLIVEIYKIYKFAKEQIIYEYYKMLAMFEEYQNKNPDGNDPTKDTMWLEEQLRWLGLTYDPRRWNTVVFGIEQAARKELEDFLKEHQGTLLREYEEQLKKLILNYLSALRPEPKEAHSQASFGTVQVVLDRYNFPYVLSRKRRSINRGDHLWWTVTSLIANDDT